MVGSVLSLVRRRPRTTIVWIAVTLTTCVMAAVLGYAAHQKKLAQVDLDNGRVSSARERLAVCLRIWPWSVSTHLLAARAARLDMDFVAAESHLNRCLDLERGATEPVQLEFLLLRAQTGEVDEVTPPLLKCVEENHPESRAILETLARYHMHHLNYKPAYMFLTRWIEQFPSDAKPHHWRGWVQERLNNHKRAMEDYLRALELDEDLTPVRLRVAEILIEDKQPLEALTHLERLQRQFPDRADIKARLGQCRFLQGENEQARQLLEAAVQKMPSDSPLLLHLGKLDLQEGRAVEAEGWLRRVLEIDPTDSEAHYALVSALQLQGRTQEAQRALEASEKAKALLERLNRLLKDEAEHSSITAEVPSEIGTLLLSAGKEPLALHWLYEALRRDPVHQATHQALAEYFESKGEAEKAAVHRRALRDSSRTDPAPRKTDSKSPNP